MAQLELPSIDTLLQDMGSTLSQWLKAHSINNPYMIGIHTGGVWVANTLHQQLGLPEALGTLDISFYRDDFSRIGMNPEVKPSSLPVSIEDRHIILVDDVLQTGRTIRAAMNELFDYGRPASITLVALVERGGRELPIQADICGCRMELAPEQQIKLEGPAPLSFKLVQTHGQ